MDFAHIPHGLWKTTEDIAQKPTPVEHGDINAVFRGVGTRPIGHFVLRPSKKGFQTLCGGEVAYPPIPTDRNANITKFWR